MTAAAAAAAAAAQQQQRHCKTRCLGKSRSDEVAGHDLLGVSQRWVRPTSFHHTKHEANGGVQGAQQGVKRSSSGRGPWAGGCGASESSDSDDGNDTGRGVDDSMHSHSRLVAGQPRWGRPPSMRKMPRVPSASDVTGPKDTDEAGVRASSFRWSRPASMTKPTPAAAHAVPAAPLGRNIHSSNNDQGHREGQDIGQQQFQGQQATSAPSTRPATQTRSTRNSTWYSGGEGASQDEGSQEGLPDWRRPQTANGNTHPATAQPRQTTAPAPAPGSAAWVRTQSLDVGAPHAGLGKEIRASSSEGDDDFGVHALKRARATRQHEHQRQQGQQLGNIGGKEGMLNGSSGESEEDLGMGNVRPIPRRHVQQHARLYDDHGQQHAANIAPLPASDYLLSRSAPESCTNIGGAAPSPAGNGQYTTQLPDNEPSSCSDVSLGAVATPAVNGHHLNSMGPLQAEPSSCSDVSAAPTPIGNGQNNSRPLSNEPSSCSDVSLGAVATPAVHGHHPNSTVPLHAGPSPNSGASLSFAPKGPFFAAQPHPEPHSAHHRHRTSTAAQAPPQELPTSRTLSFSPNASPPPKPPYPYAARSPPTSPRSHTFATSFSSPHAGDSADAVPSGFYGDVMGGRHFWTAAPRDASGTTAAPAAAAAVAVAAAPPAHWMHPEHAASHPDVAAEYAAAQHAAYEALGPGLPPFQSTARPWRVPPEGPRDTLQQPQQQRWVQLNTLDAPRFQPSQPQHLTMQQHLQPQQQPLSEAHKEGVSAPMQPRQQHLQPQQHPLSDAHSVGGATWSSGSSATGNAGVGAAHEQAQTLGSAAANAAEAAAASAAAAAASAAAAAAAAAAAGAPAVSVHPAKEMRSHWPNSSVSSSRGSSQSGGEGEEAVTSAPAPTHTLESPGALRGSRAMRHGHPPLHRHAPISTHSASSSSSGSDGSDHMEGLEAHRRTPAPSAAAAAAAPTSRHKQPFQVLGFTPGSPTSAATVSSCNNNTTTPRSKGLPSPGYARASILHSSGSPCKDPSHDAHTRASTPRSMACPHKDPSPAATSHASTPRGGRKGPRPATLKLEIPEPPPAPSPQRCPTLSHHGSPTHVHQGSPTRMYQGSPTHMHEGSPGARRVGRATLQEEEDGSSTVSSCNSSRSSSGSSGQAEEEEGAEEEAEGEDGSLSLRGAFSSRHTQNKNPGLKQAHAQHGSWASALKQGSSRPGQDSASRVPYGKGRRPSRELRQQAQHSKEAMFGSSWDDDSSACGRGDFGGMGGGGGRLKRGKGVAAAAAAEGSDEDDGGAGAAGELGGLDERALQLQQRGKGVSLTEAWMWVDRGSLESRGMLYRHIAFCRLRRCTEEEFSCV
ncbi:hypothetical protein DUNSADRAFT_15552 [Dunaliella salina]|uniref:Uncharacterized protein n=1 Tax=Dunaliella salina TaxID=3046 RepID=A0ABQ7G572_DUNSA|nr:hypothetical protein DUNSADRAFT_15552 [Dunaliella salina]|eukprot:KAF5829750.1 hypothetical protein DUNSADRAFT_15552 [Dunaliella salina]